MNIFGVERPQDAVSEESVLLVMATVEHESRMSCNSQNIVSELWSNGAATTR